MAALFFSFLLTLVTAAPASADYYAGGVGTTQFNVRMTGALNDVWRGYLGHSIDTWNATYSQGTRVVIARNTTNSPRTMTAARYDEDWLGLYTPSGTRANRSFHIQANARTIALPTGGTVATWARWVTAHELGHALSLADNPGTSQASIMKYPPSNSSPATTPRAYDISEVIRIY